MKVTGTRITLRVVDGPGAGSETMVESDRVVEVGRRSRGLAIPEDEHMSGHHFLVVRDGEECRLRDLSSTNGTFLNGKRIVETTLRNLDEIRAGGSTFVLRVEPELSRSPKREPGPEAETDLHRGQPGASPELGATTDDVGLPPRQVSVSGDSDVTSLLANVPHRGELLRLTNQTPFPTAMLYWQDDHGRSKLTRSEE